MIRFINLLLCIVLLLLFNCKKNSSGISTQNQVGEWQSLGLEEKLVNDLVLINDYLYACAGRDGLYRLNRYTSNAQWEYLGFADGDLYRQLDYGVTTLLYLPATNELLLGVNTHRDTAEIGVFRSSDFGQTWIPSDSGIRTQSHPKSSQIHFLCRDPNFSNVVFAGLSSTIYKSTNNGDTWNKVYGIREAGGLGINVIRFSLANPNEVWAGGETSRFAPILLHSSDYGNTWTNFFFPLDIGPYWRDNVVYDIKINSVTDNILYFGMLGVIVKTTDKAQTFQRILGWEDGIYRHWRLALNPENPQELLATGSYLYRTPDGGHTWQKVSPPDDRNELYALTVDWQQRVLYVSASSPGNGVYKLTF